MSASREGLSTLVLLMLALSPVPGLAQAWLPERGQGALFLMGAHADVRYHTDENGNRYDAGRIDSFTLLLGLDYGLSDRLALSLSLPYVRSRYRGHDPHLVGVPPGVKHDGVPHDAPVLDDGRYHGGWQDWQLGLRWRWRDDRWKLAPFLNLSVPSRNYPFFSHAAIGTRQKRVELGLHAATRFGPEPQAWYLAASYSYAVAESVLDVQPRWSRLGFELGYHAGERLTLRALGMWQVRHEGLDVPSGFPSDPSDPRFAQYWYQHDRLHVADSVDAGLGFGIDLDDRHRLFGHLLRNLHSRNGHALHYSIAIGVVRSF
jgi:hypothetical protein